MNKNKFTVSQLPASERPRERLRFYGASALSTMELLELVLGSGSVNQSVAELAHELMARFGSLAEASEATLEQLRQIKGLGIAKACQLKACFEIARRLSGSSKVLDADAYMDTLSTAQIVDLLRAKISSYRKEHFVLALFDARGRLITLEVLSIGTLNASLVHPRETFLAALQNNAASVVLAHNHPSGEVDPSDEDISITERLVSSGRVLGIAVQDHVIVTPHNYFSFREHGLI